MGMVIHDDFWEACQAMPAKQRAQFLYAIVLYRFEKEEPKGNPPWLPTFLVIKDRLEMGDERSGRARDAANARWEKERQRKAEEYARASCSDDASACTPADALADAEAYAAAWNSADAEVEYEIGEGEPPYSPPYALLCLDAFNAAMGTAISTLPKDALHNLARLEGKYPIEDVRAMVEHMRRKWEGTKYAAGLTPKKLFGPDDFEAFMHQSKTETEEVAKYAVYDR